MAILSEPSTPGFFDRETIDRDKYKKSLWTLRESGLYSDEVKEALNEGIRCMTLVGKIGWLYNDLERFLNDINQWRNGDGNNPL